MHKIQMVKLAIMTKRMKKHPCGCFCSIKFSKNSLPYDPKVNQKAKACDKCHRLLCWRYLSSRAVSSQVLSAEASLTSVFGMGTGGPSP